MSKIEILKDLIKQVPDVDGELESNEVAVSFCVSTEEIPILEKDIPKKNRRPLLEVESPVGVSGIFAWSAESFDDILRASNLIETFSIIIERARPMRLAYEKKLVEWRASGVTPQHHMEKILAAECQIISDREFCLVKNDFPYGKPELFSHYLFWYDPSAHQFSRGTFKSRVSSDYAISIEKIILFENPLTLESIPPASSFPYHHCQVFLPPEFKQ